MPISPNLASLGLSAATSLLSLHGQSKAAKQARGRAKAGYEATLADLKARAKEITDSGVAQMYDVEAAGLEAASAAVVATGESGVGGNVTRTVVRDIVGRTGQAKARVAQNIKTRLKQNARDVRAAGVAYQNALAGIVAPTPFGAGLEIGASYLDYLSTIPETPDGAAAPAGPAADYDIGT